MAKNNKKIKDSLLDFDKLSATLKENTSNAVQELLKEGIRNGYMEILKEAENDYDEDEYDEDEATDTEVDDTEATDDAQEDMTDVPSDEDGEGKVPEEDGDADDAADGGDEPAEEVDVDADGVEVSAEEEPVADDVPAEDDGVDMSDMEEFRVEDGYDLTQADDDDVVKVYKRLRDDDHVVVVNDGDKVSIEDKDTGAEYIVTLNGGGDDEVIADDEDGFDGEDDFSADETEENEEDPTMDEQFVYEVAMNEYDSHVGYTDNYQGDDVLTNDGNEEVSKIGRTVDKGVPQGTKKPWSGKTKKSDKPFTEGEELEEASTSVSRATYRTTGNKTHAPNNPGHMTQVSHRVSRKGEYEGDVKGAADVQQETLKVEAMVRRLKKALDENKRIVKENEELMGYLKKFKGMIREAAVTNYNLGQIIKLISENATTKDEKREIITRFGKEAVSIKASDALYESISAQLSKRTNPITESKSLTVESTQGRINETSIYMSEDMQKSLDLMARICRN